MLGNVDYLADFAEAQGAHCPHCRGHPVHFPAFCRIILKPRLNILQCRVRGGIAVIDAGTLIHRVYRLLEEIHDPFAEVITACDDFNEFFEPGRRRGAWRGNERIKGKRRYVSARRINEDFIIEVFFGEKVAVVSLPVEYEKRLLFKEQIREYDERDVGFAAPGPAEDGNVLNPVLFAQAKFVEFLAPIDDFAERVFAFCDMRRRRDEEDAFLCETSAEVLVIEEIQKRFDFLLAVQVFGEVYLP